MAQPDGVTGAGQPAVLVVDIGGTHVKFRDPDHPTVQLDSGPTLGPADVVDGVLSQASDWRYDVVSIGYPGVVIGGRIVGEPHNLGPGWVGFDFEAALGRPVRVVNDAALQALGSYQGGRMLFLGLGTGLGSTLVVDGVLVPMELAHLPYRKGRTYEDYLGKRGLRRLGLTRWRRRVVDVALRLKAALEADEVVLGGGNAKRLEELPERVRRGGNENAYLGGVRLWQGSTAAPAAALGTSAEPVLPASDPALEAAADKALELVRDGATVGLGSGRAATTFIVRLGAKIRTGLVARGVATSEVSARLAASVGVPLVELDETELDLTVDGADEVTSDLDLVKGRGGALVRERIVGAASKRRVIVVGAEKLVGRLGERGPIPVEIVPVARAPVAAAIRALGLTPALRADSAGAPIVSDSGGWTLDCTLPAPLEDPAAARELEARLLALPGVIDTGLFLGTADAVLVGHPDGHVDLLRRGKPR